MATVGIVVAGMRMEEKIEELPYGIVVHLMGTAESEQEKGAEFTPLQGMLHTS